MYSDKNEIKSNKSYSENHLCDSVGLKNAPPKFPRIILQGINKGALPEELLNHHMLHIRQNVWSLI